MLDVPDVELDPLGPRERRAPVHLRPPGDAGPDVEPSPLSLVVALHLVGERRSGTDEAHVADEHVPELRQLVDRGAAQEPPDPRDAGVAAVDRVPRALALRADDHRAQLQHRERAAGDADALLAEEHRAPVLEPHGERGGGQDRRAERQADARADDVERALGDPVRRAHRVPSAFSQTGGTPRVTTSPSAIRVAAVTSR